MSPVHVDFMQTNRRHSRVVECFGVAFPAGFALAQTGKRVRLRGNLRPRTRVCAPERAAREPAVLGAGKEGSRFCPL